ncbi:MAG: hypothetical protein HYX67_05005 [Candidatus Melainabacteria bacterium]|nr:hypothetical protein [Candidatus Melainabacteria bacterium]
MSGLYETIDSQAETAGRVPELAGFTLMQQSRRMMQRPLSIQGVELADGKRFFVNLGSQAETCARPMMFNDGMFKPATNTQPTSEDLKMALAPNTTPFAWDFRANTVDALSLERNDWPALDEAEYRRPTVPQPARVWSKEPSLSRIPAMTIKARKTAADAESLRELLQEAMDREAQRITLRTQAFKPEANEEEESAEKNSLIETAQKFLVRIRTQFINQLNKNWVRA